MGGLLGPSTENTDYVTVCEKTGEFAKGSISEDDLIAIEKISVVGPGSCGGMYTANTMASAIEAMGMSLPGSSSQDAISKAKIKDCEATGSAIKYLLEKDIKPSDIMTKKAFENAITIVIALGGLLQMQFCIYWQWLILLESLLHLTILQELEREYP